MTSSNRSPRVSVIIPVRNGAVDLQRQLRALAAQDVSDPFEVVIADNGSTDATVAVAHSWSDRLPGLRVVDASGPARAAYARNVGARHARGELLLFCDADDRVHPEWLRHLSLCLSVHDAVGGRSLVVDAASDSEAVIDELGLESVHGYLRYAISCNCGVRRKAFFGVGGFDGSYDGGHEEVDFFWRVQEAGGTLGYAPSAVVDYRQRNTLRGLFRQRRRYAATSILLWVRFHEHANLSPVSFSGSLRYCILAVLRAPLLLRRSTRSSQVTAMGWVFGLLEGHLRYRVLGAPPQRVLIS